MWLPQLYTRRQVANQSLLTGPDLQAALDNWDMVRWAWRWDRTAHLPETSPTRLSAAAALQPLCRPTAAEQGSSQGGSRRRSSRRAPQPPFPAALNGLSFSRFVIFFATVSLSNVASTALGYLVAVVAQNEAVALALGAFLCVCG